MAIEDGRAKTIADTRSSFERMQTFDPARLPREDELGKTLSFREAVPLAQRLVDLYRQLPVDGLEWFSINKLNHLKAHADADFNRFSEILKFNSESGNPKAQRDSLIQQLRGSYDAAFEQLYEAIAYATGRVTDFTQLGQSARATLQAVEDRSGELENSLRVRSKEAEGILAEIRKIAAEQGVSQQAIHFKTEAEAHTRDAGTWLKRTVWLTVALGGYSVTTLFLHRLPWISPEGPLDVVQLSVSKILIFLTITFFLVLSARNFMANRHNAVVNRHRQNALVTYQALVDAAGNNLNDIRNAAARARAATNPGSLPNPFGDPIPLPNPLGGLIDDAVNQAIAIVTERWEAAQDRITQNLQNAGANISMSYALNVATFCCKCRPRPGYEGIGTGAGPGTRPGAGTGTTSQPTGTGAGTSSQPTGGGAESKPK